MPNKAYSLWRVNGCQQGFHSVANFGFGGQKRASKPPQAISKPLALTLKDDTTDNKRTENKRQNVNASQN